VKLISFMAAGTCNSIATVSFVVLWMFLEVYYEYLPVHPIRFSSLLFQFLCSNVHCVI
jgi:hypothetical protein